MEGGGGFRGGLSKDFISTRYDKGKEMMQSFTKTLPMRKTFNEWILFVHKYFPEGGEKTHWLVNFIVAKVLNRMAKDGTLRAMGIDIRAEDISINDNQELFDEFSIIAIEQANKKWEMIIQDEYVLAGLSASDSVITLPDEIKKEE